MKITVEAELAIDAQSYFMERDSAAFRSFIAEEMSLLEYDITECWQEGGSTLVKLASKPDVAAWIPGSLAKSIPDKLEYFDVVRYDPARLAQPPYELSGHFSSRILIDPLGPGRCRHVLEQTIEFQGLWGLGSVAKKLAKKSLQESFDEMPALIDKWVQMRQELLQTRHGRERLLAGRPRVEGVPWMEEHEHSLRQASQAPPAQKRHAGRRKPRRKPAGDALASAGLEPATLDQPGGATAPMLAAASLSAPLPTGFAAAATGAITAAAEQQAAGLRLADTNGDAPGSPAARAGGSPQDAAQAGGGPGEDGKEAGTQFWDAKEQPVRHASGATVFLTPAASLAHDAAPPAAVPREAAPEAAAPAAAAPEAVAPGAAAPEASPGPRASAAAAPGTANGGVGPRVQAQWPGPAGKPVGEGASGQGDSGGSGSASSSAAGHSSSDESSGGSEAEGEARVPEAAWATTPPWRAYYRQHAMKPLRSNHSLPEPLVKRFIPKHRPQPVHVEALAGPAGQRHSGEKRGWRRGGGLLGACCVGGSATAE